MYWLGGTSSSISILEFDISVEAFAVVPAPPALFLGTDDTDLLLLQLVELRGLLCVLHSCPSTETITIWSNDQWVWRREYVIRLQQWPEFSPKMTAVVLPLGVRPEDGRILLDTGRALGFYDPLNSTLETLFSLRSDKRFFSAVLWDESLVRPHDRRRDCIRC